MSVFSSSLKILIDRNPRNGTAHWLNQRVFSVLLLPVTIIFVLSFAQHIGSGYEQNLILYKSPVRAIISFLFFGLTLLHFKQGAQVVIEDYIHDTKTHQFLLKANTLFFWSMNLIVFCALVKIVSENYWSLK